MARFTSFDDWSAWMQTVIKENGVGAITGPVLQEVLSELSDTADYLVSESGGSADARALAAEGYALGTQRSVPVTEGSPYWHNNAKYWTEVVEQMAEELGGVISDAQDATRAAADAAHDATEAAGEALAKAELAEQKAGLADDAATLANQKAGLADAAATLANEKAQYADEMGDYAKREIDGAKGDFESLDARFDHTDEISLYLEEEATPTDAQLQDEYDRTLRLAYQCITDLLAVKGSAEAATTDAERAAQNTLVVIEETREVIRQANTAAEGARQGAAEAGRQAGIAQEAAREANEQAALAGQKAAAADAAALLAQQRAALAADAAVNANTKAGLADDAATLANQKAAYAQEQGNYAKRMAEALENTGVFFEEAPLIETE